MKGNTPIVCLGLLSLVVSVNAADYPLADLDARFVPGDNPVCMEYDVGYRLLNLQIAKVAKIMAKSTVGTWRHRVTGESIPALFLDMKVDTPDSGKAGERSRVSIHDRLVAVMTLPEMKALVFAKFADEHLHPLIGFTKDVRILSVYDAQAGRIEYSTCNLNTGVTSTNLANSEALYDLSQRMKPLMEFLVSQYRAGTRYEPVGKKGRIVANCDGKMVALRIMTNPERSPMCFGRKRFESIRIVPVAEPGSSVKPREFHAWSLEFKELATMRHDAALMNAAQNAPVESVVPLVVDYELGLGSVRTTMTAIYVGDRIAAMPPQVSTKGPESGQLGSPVGVLQR